MADKSYKFFFGFAHSPSGDIHWSSKGHREGYGGLAQFGGKTRFSSEDQRRLFINRHISEGEHSNHLINMAMILLARDLEYFLSFRMRHGGNNVDSQVFDICNMYDTALWE
jgi:hypothetical protein